VCLSYSNETRYQDAPLYHLSVYQISRKLNNPFPLYDNFNTFTKKKRKKKEKKAKKLSQFLEVHISETSGAIYLKFEIWGIELEGNSTAKIVWFRTSSTKLHIRENRIIVLPVNILTVLAHRLLGPHDTLPCVLIN